MNEDVLAWIFGMVVIGVPAVAFGVRIALRPVVDGLIRLREVSVRQGETPAPDPRIPQLQADVAALRQEVERLGAVESFYKQLQAPEEIGAAKSLPTR